MLNQNKEYFPVLIVVMFSLILGTTNFVLACCKPQDCDNFGEPITLCLDEDNDGYGNQNFQIQRCPEDSEAGYVTDCTDNCPQIYNPDQLDTNGNGIGDACEPPEPQTSRLTACYPTPDFIVSTSPDIFVNTLIEDLRLTWKEVGEVDR